MNAHKKRAPVWCGLTRKRIRRLVALVVTTIAANWLSRK